MRRRNRFGLSDYDAQGKFFDPSARSLSAPAAPAPVASVPVPEVVTTATPIAAAVAPPPSLPSGTPTDLLSLRIAVLQAIQAFRTSQTAENLAALVAAKNAFRAALVALRGSGGGGGWGGWRGGWGGPKRAPYRRWGGGWNKYGAGGNWRSAGPGWASTAFSPNYGYAGGAWGSTPPGGVTPAVVQPTVAASSDPSARTTALSGFGCCGAGMMYADDPMASRANDADASTMEGIFDNLFGGDPITRRYPGKTIPEVWQIQSDYVDKYSREVYGLRSNSAMKEFEARIQGLYRLKADLSPAFAHGSLVGTRERQKLGELVEKVYDFRSDWHKAKKQYGWAPPAAPSEASAGAPAPTPTVAPSVSDDGSVNWLLWGGAAAAALVLFSKR